VRGLFSSPPGPPRRVRYSGHGEGGHFCVGEALPSVAAHGQARQVQVREWDPAAAPDEEISAVVRNLNLVLAEDLPEDPLWHGDHLREYLSVTMPGERRVSWLGQ